MKIFHRVKRLVESKIYKRKSIIPFDLNFLDGKSIAIVGGADSVFKEKNGSYIDSFDVVIRINRGIDNLVGNSEYLGTKTDILFHGLHEDPINGCGPVRPKFWKERGVKKVIFPLIDVPGESELLKTYVSRGKGELPLMQITSTIFRQIENDLLGHRTTTGFAAIYLASKQKYSKLFITGFTFFRTPHQKGYNDSVLIEEVRENIKSRNFHNPEVEFKYFVEHILKLDSIEIDSGMQEIV